MNFVQNRKLVQLHIKKRSVQEWMALLVLVLPFTFALLIEVFRLPGIIKFSIEFLLLCFCVLFIKKKYVFIDKKLKPFITIVLLYFLYTLISYLFHFQSPLFYIWGTRNTFSFYIAFFAFIAYLNEDDVDTCFKFLDIVFWINFVCAVFQYYVLGVKQDYLGGVFGTAIGSNGYTMALLCIVTIYTLLSNFNGTQTAWYCTIKCIAALVVATLAEMKFFYFVFIIVLIIASIVTKFSLRKFWIIILSIIGVAVGSVLLTSIYGFEGFFSLEGLIEYATKENYSSTRDLNRLSAIFTLSDTILTTPTQRLFGMGIGNCDVSDVHIFHSTFHQTHSYLHYEWFASVMVFIETGIVGLTLFLSFFIGCFIFSIKQFKTNPSNKLFSQMGIAMSVMCIILSFYNASLRIYSAYMIYFVLALPFIGCKQKK